MRNFFYKKLFYYHYQLPDKPTKFFLKKVFKARNLLVSELNKEFVHGSQHVYFKRYEEK